MPELYFGYRDDYQRNKHEFKATVIGVFALFLTMFLISQIGGLAGAICGGICYAIHNFWKKDNESQEERNLNQKQNK